MARPWVVDRAEGGKVPFLRGILTRSLQDAGLAFEEAYRIASDVREELAGLKEIAREELRALVLRHLDDASQEVRERYGGKPTALPTILVHFPDGHAIPFSRGQHRAGLRAGGLPVGDAAKVAARLHADLLRRRVAEIDVADLHRTTWERLQRDYGEEAAHRYLVWQEFRLSDRPLVLLVGGTDGTGKSTLATTLAPLVGIMRTQSTDLLRAVMRVMIPERLLPFLHTSSFLAWEKLPAKERPGEEAETAMAEGYLTQASLLSVACSATVQRALEERLSLLIEGVHVHPVLLEKLPSDSDAIVVPVLLAVLKREELRQRLRRRVREAPRRGRRRHLENFEAIWRLQSYLLSEADRAGIPIVVNEELESTVDKVIGILHTVLADQFRGDPERAFGQES